MAECCNGRKIKSAAPDQPSRGAHYDDKRRMRDDFSQIIKYKLAARAGHKCSNPTCGAATSGPQVTADKSIMWE